MNVKDLYELLEDIAPFGTQLEEDNSGLLVGSGSQDIGTVLFALDVTGPVIDEAVRLGAQLIITHHPLMFQPVRSMTDADYEGRLIRHLIREDISLIAVHTNWDRAVRGMNDILADKCGLMKISGEGFFRSGELPAPLTALSYADMLKSSLHTVVRVMGPENAWIRKVGVCSGAGSSEWPAAVSAGCDAFISGEIKHHHALAMAGSGLIAFECGHYATEEPGIRALASALQNRLNQLECNLRIFVSEISAYSFPRYSGRR